MNKTDEELEQYILFPFMAKWSKMSIKGLLIHLVRHSRYHRGANDNKAKGKAGPRPLVPA